MIWPFKKKMTVDYFASVLASAIKEDISVHVDAISAHAAENVSAEEIEALEPELWALELSIVDLAIAMAKSPTSMREQLLPMLVVGYSPLDSQAYLTRAKYYLDAAAPVPTQQVAIAWGKAFVLASGIEFRTERTDVNRLALEVAMGMVIAGSINGLATLTASTLQEFRITQ